MSKKTTKLLVIGDYRARMQNAAVSDDGRVAFIVWTVALADCPEPTPPGGCGVDTISPTATQTVPPIEPYPPPDETPAPYPGPAFLPFVAEESYP